MSYDASLKQLRQALTDIGIDGKHFGEHSDRIGGLSAAANKPNLSLRDLQLHGRWKTAATPMLYYKRDGNNRKKVTLAMSF